jgi:hypothetical protein
MRCALSTVIERYYPFTLRWKSIRQKNLRMPAVYSQIKAGRCPRTAPPIQLPEVTNGFEPQPLRHRHPR